MFLQSRLQPHYQSSLQAETYRLLLATRLADILQIQEPHFYRTVCVNLGGKIVQFLTLQDIGRLAAIQVSPSSYSHQQEQQCQSRSSSTFSSWNS
jgi:hypothetical protein